MSSLRSWVCVVAFVVASSIVEEVTGENGNVGVSTTISVSGNHFVDNQGRVRVFRGFNDVGEETRRVGPFDGYNYLPQNLISNETRLNILINEYGFNCFRIGAIWAALSPSENETDGAYLDALDNATRLLTRYGSFFILDMHQDALSTYGGWSDHDGAPTWVVEQTKPRHAYPWPFKTGKGDPTEAVGQAFQEIFDDTHGGRAAWASAWKIFADRFRGRPGVVGYELMNEPFAGDVWKNPLLWDPSYAGKHNLQPAFDVVAAAIREVDQETTIMYEPVTWGMIFDTSKHWYSLGSGFDHAPGGGNRSAFSYHYYCWPGRSDNGSAPYPAAKKALCHEGMGPLTFSSVEETITDLGGASFLTEWGGVYFTPPHGAPRDSTYVEETLWIMDEADRRFVSWTHWDIDYFFDPSETDDGEFLGCESSHPRGCIKDFVRPYAQAIAGTPIDMVFDHVDSGNFSLTYEPDRAIAAATEIFLPPYRYPRGYGVDVDPANAPLSWSVCENHPNKLCVRFVGDAKAKPNNFDATVTIRVWPK